MADIVRLVTNIPPPPDAELIELLSDLLELAKEGRISGFAIAYNEGNELVRTAFSYEDWQQGVGAVSLLQHDLIHQGSVLPEDE